MTKGELIKFLEPFSDEIEIFKPLRDRNGDVVGNEPITELTYSYSVVRDGTGGIILE